MNRKEASEAAAGAPGTVIVGEKTFLVGQATIASLMAVRAWIRKRVKAQRPLEAILPDLAGLSPDLQKIAVAEAVRNQPGGGKIDNEQATDQLMTADGASFVLWLHAKQIDPALTLESVRALITDDSAADIFFQLDEATGLSQLGKGAGQSG